MTKYQPRRNSSSPSQIPNKLKLSPVTDAPNGSILSVRVITRTGKSGFGVRGGIFFVRLTAAPVAGAANTALLRLLAKQLGIARRRITIRSGTCTRNKKIYIEGLQATNVAYALWKGAV